MENSPLNRIPAELRNRISELVLTEPYGIRIDVSFHTPKAARTGHIVGPEKTISAVPPPSIALTATCKQLRRECRIMYFDLNKLHVETLCEDNSDRGERPWVFSLSKWTRAVGEAAVRAIRTVEVDVGDHTLGGRPTALYVEPNDINDAVELFASGTQVELTLRAFAGVTHVSCLSFTFDHRMEERLEEHVGKLEMTPGGPLDTVFNSMRLMVYVYGLESWMEELKKTPSWPRMHYGLVGVEVREDSGTARNDDQALGFGDLAL